LSLLRAGCSGCGSDRSSAPVPEGTGFAAIPLFLLQQGLSDVPPELLTSKQFPFRLADQGFVATTTINQGLQKYIDSTTRTAISAAVSIVCMDPVSGRIMAMSGFDRSTPGCRVWTERLFPSASLFKIVTAAGAVELFGMAGDSIFTFNGGKHTLYRYQLKNIRNKYSNVVTLKEAFSESINPIFGKIGIAYLKKAGIKEMADRFLWERDIPFELPVRKSTIAVKDSTFNWAEVASGFNRDTRVTALHAALISACIANQGVIMVPSFIDSIRDNNGKIVYQNKIYPLARPIDPRTADVLATFMEATIDKGTARKAFAGLKRDKVLKYLVIGGKTGTIDNETNEVRYDLFSGFAKEKTGSRHMAVAVIVAHRGVLGTRAARYARLAIRKYFEMMKGQGK